MAYDRNLNDYKFEYYPSDSFSLYAKKKPRKVSVSMIFAVILFIIAAMSFVFLSSSMQYALHASLVALVISGRLAITGLSESDSRLFQCAIFLFILIPSFMALVVLGIMGFNALSRFF